MNRKYKVNNQITLFKEIIKKFIKEKCKKIFISKRFINKIKGLIKKFNLYIKNHIILNNQKGNSHNWQKFITYNLIPLIAKNLLMNKDLCYKNKYKEHINASISNFTNSKIMDIEILNKKRAISQHKKTSLKFSYLEII
ncbi:hypothetical protein BOFE_06230 [Candidatus Borrelia fainii]|uniref:Uncharacterized protein n=1 Tax=Candidatus Borrelia fainii TaxID=2518322 RepID=A0ABM8DKG7_9SPIR|nr:hypothetical protein [Candidatus Borrelia fainii]BDU63083.1 hypothetical protein BOFE_06230 [Candidatus Borrelia fainii]